LHRQQLTEGTPEVVPGQRHAAKGEEECWLGQQPASGDICVELRWWPQVSSYQRENIRLTPSSETKVKVYAAYSAAMHDLGT